MMLPKNVKQRKSLVFRNWGYKMTNEIMDRLELAAMECVYIKEDSRLAKAFSLKRDTSLLKLNKRCERKKKRVKDPRSISVKFDNNQNVTKFTQERLDILNKYRTMVENDQPIEFDENERLLNNNIVAFVSGMYNGGME
jgi:hypothetical protein